MNIYQENGYKNRTDYLKSLAESYEVSIGTVILLAGTLCKSEDFNALVTAVEDYAEGMW